MTKTETKITTPVKTVAYPSVLDYVQSNELCQQQTRAMAADAFSAFAAHGL